jgi:hypothetical protein
MNQNTKIIAKLWWGGATSMFDKTGLNKSPMDCVSLFDFAWPHVAQAVFHPPKRKGFFGRLLLRMITVQMALLYRS